jgi:hypothetical protein
VIWGKILKGGDKKWKMRRKKGEKTKDKVEIEVEIVE